MKNAAVALFELACTTAKGNDGRIRAEDVISASASIVGERCIEAAGHLNPRQHAFTPGAPVLSDKVNALLCGDSGALALGALPPTCVYGLMRDALVARGYQTDEFPSIESIFKSYAANLGGGGPWGFVPLSVPMDNVPVMMPIRIAYETRPAVDAILDALHADTLVRLDAAVYGLVESLAAVAGVIDHRTALLIAMETVNGLAKTAPMTDEAFARLQR